MGEDNSKLFELFPFAWSLVYLRVVVEQMQIFILGNLILINAKPQQNTTLTETELVKNFLTVVR